MNEQQRGSLARPELAGRARWILVVLAFAMAALAVTAALNIHLVFTPSPAGAITALLIVAEVLAFAGVVTLLLCAFFTLVLRSAIDGSGVDLGRARRAEASMRHIRLAATVLLVAGPVTQMAGLLPVAGGWETAVVGLVTAAIPYGLLFVMCQQAHKLCRAFAGL